LQRRRQKVRLLQQRKAAEVMEFKDLPEEIPLPLVIGTRVTGEWEIPLPLIILLPVTGVEILLQ